MIAEREIHTGHARHKAIPNTWLVYAECEDEVTQLIFANPTPELRAMFDVGSEQIGDSEFYSRLVEDHAAQCGACQRWATA